MSGGLRATLEAELAGRYAIERELGRGGMATVYLARDLLSPGWLKIDPTFDSLRKLPRFQALVAETR